MKFKKGHQLGGRPSLSPEAKEAKRITSDEFIKISCELFRKTPQEICDTANDPRTDAMTALLCRMIVTAIDTADEHRAEFLLERVIGHAPAAVPPVQAATIVFTPFSPEVHSV